MQNYTGSVVKYEAYTHQPAGEDFFTIISALLFYSSCYFALHFSLYLFSFLLLVHPPTSAKPEGSNPADKRKALYQKFYKLVQEERKPADCVVISITNQCLWVQTVWFKHCGCLHMSVQTDTDMGRTSLNGCSLGIYVNSTLRIKVFNELLKNIQYSLLMLLKGCQAISMICGMIEAVS